MDYNYENLGPERFQVFCQALLNSENTKIQSFPIGHLMEEEMLLN